MNAKLLTRNINHRRTWARYTFAWQCSSCDAYYQLCTTYQNGEYKHLELEG